MQLILIIDPSVVHAVLCFLLAAGSWQLKVGFRRRN